MPILPRSPVWKAVTYTTKPWPNSHEATPLPAELDYHRVEGLSNEIRQKLSDTRPETLAHAARISGVTPAAISILLVHLKKRRLNGVAPRLDQGLSALGVIISAEQREQLLGLLALLHKWNRAYNLTAVRDVEEMVSRYSRL